MHRTSAQIDEYILAAYLSGRLPDRLRKEIIAYLAENAGARELLGMAGDALEVIESGDGAPVQTLDLFPEAQDPSVQHDTSSMEVAIEASRPSVGRSESNRSIWRVVFLIATAVLIMAITLVLHVISDMQQAATATLPVATGQWQPEIGLDNLTISWQPVEEARTYHLIVFDPLNDQTVAKVETTEASAVQLPTDLSLESLDQGTRLIMWIEAFDEGGQFLQASSRVAVTRTGYRSLLGEELP